MFLCLVFLMLSHPFVEALWSPAGKVLTSWLLLVMFYCIFVTFLCDILGQVWYLIVSFPDLCHHSYFYCAVHNVVFSFASWLLYLNCLLMACNCLRSVFSSWHHTFVCCV